MELKQLLDKLEGVKTSGAGHVALCPAHDDKSPSLSVGTGDDGRLLLNCQAGCTTEAVVSALGFKVEDHPHSLNALRPGSQLSIQFTKDARYANFPVRSEIRETLGLRLRVALLADLVQAKIWAWSDPQRRLSKRKKDELDLIRVAEKFPQFIPQLPEAIRRQLA